MMKWKKCFNCFHDGKCQNQNVEHPCNKILDEMCNSNSQKLEYLRGRLKLADTIFELIRLSKEVPAINREDVIGLALALWRNESRLYAD